MFKRPSPTHLQWLALLVGVPLVVLLLSVGIWSLFSRTTTNDLHSNNSNGGNSIQTAGVSVTPGPTGEAQVPNSSVSPLLFGTNLSLYDSNDQVLQSITTRNVLEQLHFRIIRMPVRSNLSNETEIQAAQAIKSVGAYALVVLRGAVDNNVLADDISVIHAMNGIFGNTTVYYEYGNEEDLLGVDVNRYIASWNTVVPQLKRLALHGQFIGPVNFQYDRNYLITFLQQANPRPDQVSWHEYTCDDSWSTDICLSHIDHWTVHISDARSAMQAAIGTALPIMITEWNYAPNAQPNDGKINNDSFMSAWTTKAVQTLAANRIFASMQYACTNSVYALVRSDGTPTVQGLTMQSLYSHLILDGQQPTPIPSEPGQVQPGATPTPTEVLPQHIAFSFEDGGVNGWSKYGKEISLIENSTANKLEGSHSLHVVLSNMSSSSNPYILSPGITNGPQSGQTLDAYVYLPSDAVSFTAKVFAVDSSWHWYFNEMSTLAPGIWNHLTYTIPSSVGGQIYRIGVQFGSTTNMPMSSDVFVDAVGWH